MSAQPGQTPPRRQKGKPVLLHRVRRPDCEAAWFTGGDVRTACGLEAKPMRPGTYRWATETGRAIPEDCPECYPVETAAQSEGDNSAP